MVGIIRLMRQIWEILVPVRRDRRLKSSLVTKSSHFAFSGLQSSLILRIYHGSLFRILAPKARVHLTVNCSSQCFPDTLSHTVSHDPNEQRESYIVDVHVCLWQQPSSFRSFLMVVCPWDPLRSPLGFGLDLAERSSGLSLRLVRPIFKLAHTSFIC